MEDEYDAYPTGTRDQSDDKFSSVKSELDEKLSQMKMQLDDGESPEPISWQKQKAMEDKKRNMIIGLVVALVIVLWLFTFGPLSTPPPKLGTPLNPYNPAGGFQGPGYYNISGTAVYIATLEQLTNPNSYRIATQNTSSSASLANDTLTTVYPSALPGDVNSTVYVLMQLNPEYGGEIMGNFTYDGHVYWASTNSHSAILAAPQGIAVYVKALPGSGTKGNWTFSNFTCTGSGCYSGNASYTVIRVDGNVVETANFKERNLS